MSIEFRCSNCNKLLRTPDGSAGRQAQCPQCHSMMTIPSDPLGPSGVVGATGSASAGVASNAGGTRGPSRPAEPPPARSAPGPVQAAATAYASGGPSGTAASAAPISDTTLEMGDIFSTTWNIFKREAANCIIAGLVCLMVALVAAVVVTIVALLIISLTVALLGVLGVLMAVPMWAGLVLAMMLITSFFMLNMTRLFLAIARGQRADVATLFRFSPYFWKFFGTQLLLAIIGAVVGILGIIVSLISALAVSSIPLKVLLGFLAMILGVLPALVVGVIFFPSLMLVADRGLKPIDALTEAKRLTTGLWLNLLVILIVAGVLAALFSGLTFGLGMLVAQPFIFLMFQVIYLRLSGQRVG